MPRRLWTGPSVTRDAGGAAGTGPLVKRFGLGRQHFPHAILVGRGCHLKG